jgi:hypothetical protein
MVDTEKYLPYLDRYEWSREEKIELLHSVWRMMEAEADKAFGLNSYQLSCGQVPDNNLQNHKDSVNSKVQVISDCYRHAANDEAQEVKGKRHAG